MNDEKRAHFRDRLLTDLQDLDREDALGIEGQRPVTLDQQSVGRLSRMDALQGQAMAQATQARRTAGRLKIIAALARIEDGEYGYCLECDEEISEKRLALDPAIATCISCAAGR